MRSIDLPVPSPPEPARLDMFVAANVHGLSRRRVKALLDGGGVRVDGRPMRKGGRMLRPGQVVTVTFRPSELGTPPPLGRGALIETGDGWWAVHKPHGVASHRSSEEGVGVPELAAELLGGLPDVRPAHRLDRETSGVLLLATGAARAVLSSAFEAREVAKVYRAIVQPGPVKGSGELTDTDDSGRPMHATFRVLRRSADGSRAELSVSPREGRTHQVRIQLASAGTPILGDLVHGRPVPGGAPRMALHCEELSWGEHSVKCPPPGAWRGLLERTAVRGGAPARKTKPEKKARPEKRESTGGPKPPVSHKRGGKRHQLRVSRATARILSGGHPWVVADRDTGPMHTLRPGQVVDLVDGSGGFVAVALADPSAKVCARAVSTRPIDTLDRVGWRHRAERALARRATLLDAPDTDALRLIHGEADGLPGLFVDLWGPCLVATRTAACASAFTDTVYQVLGERFGDLPLCEKDHWTDLRARAAGTSDASLPGRWIREPAAGHPAANGPEGWTVLEDGSRYAVEPTAGLTTWLYPDQRTNRRLLATRLRSRDDWAVGNLFAHTGAFSVALARAGAARTYTVDLSPQYLDVYRRNLALNDLDPAAHEAIAADALRWLASAPPLDVAILDPPAFARGRKRGSGWNAQRDYAALVEASARVLKPGGLLLCCHNLRSARKGWLRKQVEAGVTAAGRKLTRTEPAGPAPDFPTVGGFPEGHTFRGLLATVG